MGRIGAAAAAAVVLGIGCASDTAAPSASEEPSAMTQLRATSPPTTVASAVATTQGFVESADTQPEPVVTTQPPDDSPSSLETESDVAETAAEGDASGSGTVYEADEDPDSSADTGSASDTAESEEDEGTGGESETEAEGSETQQGGTDAAESEAAPAIKNYKNRSTDSVLPASDIFYFDHDEIAALFPECGPFPTSPEARDWLDNIFNFWDRVYANWDTETHNAGGVRLASGWWTTEQIRMRYPHSTITAAEAKANAFYSRSLDFPFLWEPYRHDLTNTEGYIFYPHKSDDGYVFFPNLYARAAVAGYSSTDAAPATEEELLRLFRDNGIAHPGPNPPSADVGQMLAEWTVYRYSLPPTTREPTAWAMVTLLETRDSNCFVPKMRAICESGEQQESRHLRHPSQGGSRLGAALWSIVCPEVEP